MATEDPNLTNADAARILNVSKQRISQICRQRGIRLRAVFEVGTSTIADAAKGALPPLSVKAPGHCGYGAAGELIVAADLIGRGFFIYQSMAGNAPFDLIATDGANMLRIEVKRRSQEYVHIPREKRDRYDVLAVVGVEGRIQYFPDFVSR